MATQLAINDRLLARAHRLSKQKSKVATVSIALEEYVQRRNRLRALERLGTFSFDPTYDYKKARKKR